MTTLREIDFYSRLGAHIRQAREAKGLTQLQLAVELDRQSGAAVSYWESGLHRPALFTVLEMERVLGARLHVC